MKNYLKEMKECIRLAKLAQGCTSPNPLVGCVVLNSNGEIAATGYHVKCGEYHAERDALSKLEKGQGHTLIVNLEPCCHYGKTPPCTDIIIDKGIKRVVYGMKDPNPLVAGKGLQILKDAGIEVIGPVAENECRKLNDVFIKNQTEKRTYIALKTAATIDGKIATYSGDSKWITSTNARNHVKKLRNIYDAILTSSSTVLADNPIMEHRIKVILDRELKTDFQNAKIYNQGINYVFYDENNTSSQIICPKYPKISFIPAPVRRNKLDIEYILKKIFDIGIMSVFVESGGVLNGSFLPYIDKLYQFIAPKILGDNSAKSCFDGLKAEKISECTDFKLDSVEIFSPDVLLTYYKN